MQPNGRDECLISKLSTFLQENRSEIINGKKKLSLRSSILCALNRIFFTFNRNNLTTINNSSFEENLNVLINIINNITALKIVHGDETVQGGIDLSVFQSLLILELKKFPVHLLVGLHLLRLQLQTLICSRSIASLEELFVNEANSEWIALKYLNLSYNYLEKIDVNLALNGKPLILFPNLETLNMSHNKLKSADGIQFLSKLRAIDLGYNNLEKIPIFNSDAYFHLKELSLRNNNLEDLNGLERIRNLQDLDLSYNCLSEHAVLHLLQNLPYLKILKLEGNPLAYHCQHRNLTVKNLHPNVCTVGIIIDDDKLTRAAISKIIKVRDISSEVHESYTRVKISSHLEEAPIVIEEQDPPAVICNLPSYIKEHEVSVASESFLKDDTINEDTISLISSNKESAKELSKTKAKQKKTREAVILDSGTSSKEDYKELKQIQKEDAKSIPSSTEGSTRQLLKTKTKQKKNKEVVILDSGALGDNNWKKTFHKTKRENKDVEHISIKKELEARREQLGQEWLISAYSPVFTKNEKITEEGQNNFTSPNNSSNANDNETTNPEQIPSCNENVQVDRKISDISDGIEVLSSATENINQKETSAELCEKYTCVEENENAVENVFCKCPGYTKKGFASVDEDEDAEENIFILEKGDGENQSTIFISIGKQYLKEKDILSAHLIDSLDLKVLESIEKCGEKTVKLMFNMLKKSRRERIYHMENEMAVEKILNLLKPHADASCLKNIVENTLKCVKCGAQFSKGAAKQKVFEDKNPGTGESRHYLSEGSFKEINICPKCGSPIVIEDYSTPIDTLLNQDNRISDYFLKPQNFLESSSPSSTGLLSNLLLSLKKPPKEKRSDVKKISLEINSKDNTVGKRRSNSIDNSRISFSKFTSSMGVLNTVDNISIKSNNSEETISQRQPELREDFRRSSSDITILSNPSQSSITVISGSGSDYSSDFNTFLDEQSLCNTLLTRTLKIENQSTHEGTNISQSLKSNTQETTSSDSEVSSVCTALEHSKPNSPINSQHTLMTLETGRNSADSYTVDKNFNYTEEKSISDKSFSLENTEWKHEQEITASNNNNNNNDGIETTKTNLKLDKWSEFDLIEQISINNFISINHRLKLYLEMQLFDMDEELEAIAEATVITHSTLLEIDGLLALSTKRVHFLELEGDPRDDPEKAVTLFESKDLFQLNTISTLLGNQGVALIWVTEKQPSCKYCYTCLFRDADYCNCFLTYLSDFVKERMNSPPQIDTSSEISLKQLTQELFLQNSSSNDSNAEILVFLLIENLTIDKVNKDVRPLAVVLTPVDICITGISFTQVSSQSAKSFQPIERYTLIDNQKIINIITVHLCTDMCQVGLHFLDEDSNNEFCWLVKTKSKSALFSLLHALKDPWEQQFGIELQLNRITDCKYCT